jgi:hypothetical protein
MKLAEDPTNTEEVEPGNLIDRNGSIMDRHSRIIVNPPFLKVKVKSLKCQVCHIVLYFESCSYIQHEFLNLFPANFAMIELLDSMSSNVDKVEGCPDHDLQANIFCLSPFCNDRNPVCFGCMREKHAKCPSEYFVDSNTFHLRVKYNSYDTSYDTFSKNIDLVAESINAQFLGVIKASINAFKEKVQEKYLFFDTGNIRSIKKHLRDTAVMSTTETSDAGKGIEIRPQNKQALERVLNVDDYKEKLTGIVNEHFAHTFRIEFERITNLLFSDYLPETGAQGE